MLPVPAFSEDRLELQNGDIVSGTIVRMSTDIVVIRTEYGVLEIPRDAVSRGSFGESEQSGQHADDESPGTLSMPEIQAEIQAEAQPETRGETRAEEQTPAAVAPTDDSPAATHDGPILHFPFDGDLRNAATTGPVSAGGGYTITNNGLEFTQDYAGTARGALYSSGNGTYLSVAPSPQLNALDAFSVLFRVRLDSTEGTSYLVSKWGQAQGGRAEGKFTVQSSNGALTLFLVAEDGAYHWIGADDVLQADRWHSVAASFADGTATLYVDGSAVRRREFSFSQLYEDEAPLLIMTAEANTNDSYGYYNAPGSIDDLQLYDRALSETELAATGILTAR